MASIALHARANPVASQRDRALDWLEKAIVVGLFASFAERNYHAVVDQGHWFNVIMVASEALVALFVLIRRPSTEVTHRPGDWLLAFAATVGPLLAGATSRSHPLIPQGSGVMILLVGLALQIWAKLTLRRSFGIVPANRGVKANGPYRFVRHPMYLGYVTVHVGFLLLSPNVWNIVVYGVSFAIQLVRMRAEERLLGCDPTYAAFAGKTRFRLLPGVF